MRRSQHVLLGGTFIGVLSSLPFVNAANCCCLWVIIGGLLTAHLQQQNQDTRPETADVALSGLLAGLLGAVIRVAVTGVMYAAAGGAIEPAIQDQFRDNPQIPPEVRDMVVRLMAGPSLLVILAAVWIPLYSVVSALGALLGLALFGKKVPPAEPA